MRKKKRSIENNKALNDESTSEPISNQVTCDTNKLSKHTLKDIQLVPINKVPGKSWIWCYYQLYKPVEPY
ncbi:13028_t:CDS:1, partial [Gigaspora rosea]